MPRPLAVLLLLVIALPARAEVKHFPPDSATVQRFESAYRYPQAGWTVLHIEGEPYARGVQHGRLMAREIQDFLKCLALEKSAKAPSDAWRLVRTIANANFLRGFEPEYLEEMKGIADGASAAGANCDGRAVDLLDIAALNLWPELMTLDGGLEALPTGLEGKVFAKAVRQAPPPEDGDHCSAFAATGPATADGKIVFGHITMFGLHTVRWFNVWLDVKPAHGHRIVMQSFPGGVMSGMDFYINSAGIMVSETTIKQTRFHAPGKPLANRIRKALQYASSIDEAVATMREGNNGLYTNEWLLGDAKTNEIALFELGTHTSKLMRSSRGEWFGGTEGFYWGCNNVKDMTVRLEGVSSVAGRPANVVWHPSERDTVWLNLYERHKGHIDADFGKSALSNPPLAAYRSVDAKVTTTDLAKMLATHAHFGPPSGRLWQPDRDELARIPDIRPLVPNPWTVLSATAPPVEKIAAAKDLPARIASAHPSNDPSPDTSVPAWHGTVLPQTDADIWLAAAFSDYERYVALEKALRERHGGKLNDDDQRRLRIEIAKALTTFSATAAVEDVPLSQVKVNGSDHYYKLASGKGFLLLHELRQALGDEQFIAQMDAFGRKHAGQEVSTRQFLSNMSQRREALPSEFWPTWLEKPGLPAKFAGQTFGLVSCFDDHQHTIIVYGTADDADANRETALLLRDAVRARRYNFTLPVRSDKDVTSEELQANHVLLVGRPATLAPSLKVRDRFPVTFGDRSFRVGRETYAHAGSAVIAAAVSPWNAKKSVVILAGNSADAVTRTPRALCRHAPSGADIYILPEHGRAAADASWGMNTP